jgi:hypothetical protein
MTRDKLTGRRVPNKASSVKPAAPQQSQETDELLGPLHALRRVNLDEDSNESNGGHVTRSRTKRARFSLSPPLSKDLDQASPAASSSSSSLSLSSSHKLPAASKPSTPALARPPKWIPPNTPTSKKDRIPAPNTTLATLPGPTPTVRPLPSSKSLRKQLLRTRQMEQDRKAANRPLRYLSSYGPTPTSHHLACKPPPHSTIGLNPSIPPVQAMNPPQCVPPILPQLYDFRRSDSVMTKSFRPYHPVRLKPEGVHHHLIWAVVERKAEGVDPMRHSGSTDASGQAADGQALPEIAS